MSQTTQTVAPPQDGAPSGDPVVAKQDAWVTKFTGEATDRSKLTLGTHRTPGTPPTSPPTPSTAPPQPWQRATPTGDESAKKPQERDKKLAEVDAAIKTMTAAADAIGSPVGRKTVEPEMAQIQIRRDALANAADRAEVAKQMAAAPALLADIEKVRLAAVQAKTDWTAQATKLAEVDAAMLALTGAVGAIGSPVGRKTFEPVVAQVKGRRDALANAATQPDVATQVAAAPALLTDIGKAKAAADKAKTDWEAVAAKKAKVDTTLQNARAWLGVAANGPQKKALLDETSALEKSLKDLDGVATLKAYQDGVSAAKVSSDTLVGKAIALGAPGNADSWLKTLAGWLPLYKKIADPNPVSRQHKALTDRRNAAGGTSDPTSTYHGITNDAVAANTDAKAAYAARDAINRYIAAAEGGLSGLPPEQQGAVVAQRDLLLGKISNAFSTAATAGALKATLDTLKTDAQVLQAQTISLTKQTAEVQASLAEAKKAVDGLADGTDKTNFAKQYAILQKRLTDAPKLGTVLAQKQELVALGKDALVLVEATRKAGFAAESATPEGKAKIDKLISDYGASTDDPVKQAVCRAAIAGCYDVPLDIPEGMSVKTLPAIYQMMTKVPAKDLKGLKGIEYETDPLMGSSYYGSGKVVLNKIGDGTSTYDMVNQADPSKKEQVNYFNATTLHELGHYVDDNNGVMKSHMETADFGNWKAESIDTVATAYSPKFAAFVGAGKKPTQADIMALITTVLESGDAKKPASATAPLGSLFDDWTSIVASQGYKDCVAIRDSEKSPWDKPVAAPDGRAYHEGYAGQWYSYAMTERSKGISDYQWRAPAEWFAEQYAFYRLLPDKTKPAAIANYLVM